MSRPTDFQIALATVLVKHKPKDVFIKDYIRNLRVHLKSGRQSNRDYRHLDQASHWQSECKRYQTILDQEQNISFTLRQQNEALQQQIQALQFQSTQSSTLVPKKRKVIDDGKELPKRGRFGVVMPTPSFAVDVESLQNGQLGTKLLRSLRDLHSMLKGEMYAVEAMHLAAHLNNTAEAISCIVDSISVGSRSTSKARARELATEHLHTITVVARAVTTLLHGLKKLSEMNRSDRYTGNSIFHCSRVIDTVFTAIEEAATCEARVQLAAELSTKPSNKPKRAGKLPCSLNQTIMSHLTNLVLAIVTHLNTGLSSHAQLLEALLYHLLSRIGEIEHLFTFSGPRSTDIEDEIRNLPPPNDEKRLDPARKLERRAMTIEAPYMIAVLRKALTAVPSAFRRSWPEGLSEKHYLTPVMLNKLQRTLVDCVFGPDARGSEASRDVLKMPALKGEAVDERDAVKMKANGDGEDGEAEWFEGQLWGLLGWDILGREEDL